MSRPASWCVMWQTDPMSYLRAHATLPLSGSMWSPRDTVFTTEYAVRTAMEAVYTLLVLDRGVPEAFASCYDVRALLDATAGLMDGRKITDMKLGFVEKIALDAVMKRTRGTVIEEMLKQYDLI